MIALGGGVRARRSASSSGFEQVGAGLAVNTSFREAVKRLAGLGAILEWISTPVHLVAAAVWAPIGTEVGRLEEDVGTGNEMLAVAHG